MPSMPGWMARSVRRHLMPLTRHQIQLAVDHTTGPGNMTPNSHRVKSWLLCFEGYTAIDYGESFDQIAEFIWDGYGSKTMLSDNTVMGGLTKLDGEYYLRPSASYNT